MRHPVEALEGVTEHVIECARSCLEATYCGFSRGLSAVQINRKQIRLERPRETKKKGRIKERTEFFPQGRDTIHYPVVHESNLGPTGFKVSLRTSDVSHVAAAGAMHPEFESGRTRLVSADSDAFTSAPADSISDTCSGLERFLKFSR